jgi:hypothetical protein
MSRHVTVQSLGVGLAVVLEVVQRVVLLTEEVSALVKVKKPSKGAAILVRCHIAACRRMVCVPGRVYSSLLAGSVKASVQGAVLGLA